MLKVLVTVLYSFASSLMFAVFWHTQGFTKHFFSLGAVLVGMYFFRRYRSKGMRYSYTALTIVLWFAFLIIFALASET